MKLNASLAVASVAVLIGCGGGGGSVSSTQPSTPMPSNGFTAPPVAIASFENGGGVLRAAYNPKVIVITDDLQAWRTNLTAQEISSIDVGTLQDHTFGWSLSDVSRYYEGQVTLAGAQYIASIFTPYEGGTTAVLVFTDTLEFKSATIWGPEVTEIPSGQFQYSGLNIIGLIDAPPANQPITYGNGNGRFQMNVNFDTREGSILAETSEINNTTMSGVFQIDSANGTFSSDSLVLNGQLEDVVISAQPASIIGNFHGLGGQGVSGVYFSNDETIGGVILGSKNP
jgi:hypothetical protein